MTLANSQSDAGIEPCELSGKKLIARMTSEAPGPLAPLMPLGSKGPTWTNESEHGRRRPADQPRQNPEIQEESDPNSSVASCVGDPDKEGEAGGRKRSGRRLKIAVGAQLIGGKGGKSRMSGAEGKRSGSSELPRRQIDVCAF